MANDTAAASGCWPFNTGDFNAGTAASQVGRPRYSTHNKLIYYNNISQAMLDMYLKTGEKVINAVMV